MNSHVVHFVLCFEVLGEADAERVVVRRTWYDERGEVLMADTCILPRGRLQSFARTMRRGPTLDGYAVSVITKEPGL